MARKLVNFHVVGMTQLRAAARAVERLGATEVEALIGTNLVDPPYPFFLEYGTRNMAAHPSARPAFFVAQHEAEAVAARTLAAFIAARQYNTGALVATAKAAALPIQNQWKRLAPYRTGTYRKSIHTVTQVG